MFDGKEVVSFIGKGTEHGRQRLFALYGWDTQAIVGKSHKFSMFMFGSYFIKPSVSNLCISQAC